MPQAAVLRLTDIAVIALVCKVAAWAVLRNHFVESPGEGQIFAWYALAAVYGLAAWLYSLHRRLLSLLLLSLGATASAISIAARGSSDVVTSLDWLLLACAVALRLATSWRLRHAPSDDNQI